MSRPPLDLTRTRRWVEGRFNVPVRIETRVGVPVMDEATLIVTPPVPVVFYEGDAMVRAEFRPQTDLAGQITGQMQRVIVRVPVGVDPPEGAWIVLTGGEADQIGNEFRVETPDPRSTRSTNQIHSEWVTH